MVPHLIQNEGVEYTFKLVNDYNQPSKLIDATLSTYVISEEIPSPMGEFLSAFSSKKEAEEILQVKKGEMNFDVVVASPDAMRVVGQLGQILGPRGLMPNPKTGTVTPDVATAVKNAKAGQVRYRNDKNGIIHASIGKIAFEENQIKENLEALLEALKKAKPSSAKGTFIKKISLSTTMGAGVIVDQGTLGAQ